MRRFASFWLPNWATDRWRWQNRPVAGPLALVAAGQGGLRLTAVDEAAAEEGLTPGMTLADARALAAGLFVAEADPRADAAALDQLVLWCRRFAPWAAMDGADGIILEITGCAHLFGDEAGLIEDAMRRLLAAGVAVRPAVADTPAAAWAWARFRLPQGASPILPAGDAAQARLALLPTAGLRLPEDTVEALCRVGLRSIGEVMRMPRAPLVMRYGEAVARRLDQLQGREAQPITPRASPPEWSCRAAFLEPISRREDLEIATARLTSRLCAMLREAGRGARRLELVFCRVDATAQRLAIGTSRPSHDAPHLLRLFREKLDGIEPGFGIEAMALAAAATDRLEAAQAGFADPADGTDLAQLVDRLRGRAGVAAVREFAPRDTHIPEREAALQPVDLTRRAAAGGLCCAPRPIMLLDRPEPIDAAPPLPEAPPLRFRWRGRSYEVSQFEGPERIAPEWWRGGAAESPARDYYRIEALEGCRFWIFRGVGDASWYVHGLFA
jgi:protein ImuB